MKRRSQIKCQAIRLSTAPLQIVYRDFWPLKRFTSPIDAELDLDSELPYPVFNAVDYDLRVFFSLTLLFRSVTSPHAKCYWY